MMNIQPACRISLQTKYVRPGCPADTQNLDDFCTYRVNIGVQDKGFQKIGRLHVENGKRPNLIIGHSADGYKHYVELANNVRRDQRNGVLKELVRMGVGNTVWAGALAFAFGALSFPVGLGMALKSGLIGAGWACLVGAVDYFKATREYRYAVRCLDSLNDMVNVVHTGKFAAWMYDQHEVNERHRANPDVFNQATSELVGLGIALPWMIAEELQAAITPELDLPDMPELPDVPSTASPEPARGAA